MGSSRALLSMNAFQLVHYNKGDHTPLKFFTSTVFPCLIITFHLMINYIGILSHWASCNEEIKERVPTCFAKIVKTTSFSIIDKFSNPLPKLPERIIWIYMRFLRRVSQDQPSHICIGFKRGKLEKHKGTSDVNARASQCCEWRS